MIHEAIAGAANGAAQNPANFSKGMVTATRTADDGTVLVTVSGREMVATAPAPKIGQWVIWSRNPAFVVGSIAGS